MAIIQKEVELSTKGLPLEGRLLRKYQRAVGRHHAGSRTNEKVRALTQGLRNDSVTNITPVSKRMRRIDRYSTIQKHLRIGNRHWRLQEGTLQTTIHPCF